MEHLEELRTRMEKLNKIASHYGIDINKHDENKEESDKLNKDLA